MSHAFDLSLSEFIGFLKDVLRKIKQGGFSAKVFLESFVRRSYKFRLVALKYCTYVIMVDELVFLRVHKLWMYFFLFRVCQEKISVNSSDEIF